jgi:hypothetical protein
MSGLRPLAGSTRMRQGCFQGLRFGRAGAKMRFELPILPDIRDGLTHRERIVLWCLSELQKERGNRHVPTGMLYGSVVEHVNMTVDEMQSMLVRLIGDTLRP